MSKTLSAVAAKEFDSMVKQAYQGMGMLKNTVTVRNNVVGDVYNFRRMGKGLANQKSTADLVTPMDVGHDLLPCTLTNWNAPEYTDIFDQATVNFDEKRELAMTIAGALGRRVDQLVIDAMDDAADSTAGVPFQIPAENLIDVGGENLSMDALISAQVALKSQGVPGTELHAVIETGGLGGLLNDEKATNFFYQNVKALVNGDIDTLLGFKFTVLENRAGAEGGLTQVGNVVDSYFYQTPAVGLAIGIDMKTEVNWIPERTAWLSNGMLKAGSCVRDSEGVVQIKYTNNGTNPN